LRADVLGDAIPTVAFGDSIIPASRRRPFDPDRTLLRVALLQYVEVASVRKGELMDRQEFEAE
jgi:hypothetical protein